MLPLRPNGVKIFLHPIVQILDVSGQFRWNRPPRRLVAPELDDPVELRGLKSDDPHSVKVSVMRMYAEVTMESFDNDRYALPCRPAKD